MHPQWFALHHCTSLHPFRHTTPIHQIWQDGYVSAKPPVPTWLLAIGASAIVFGLATCECAAAA